MQIVCTHCSAKNRVPDDKLDHVLACGKCGVDLMTSEPFELNDQTFEGYIAGTQLPIVVDFWATWCEACMEEMPSMVALREKYAAQGFEILAINVDENPSQSVPPIVNSLKIKFPIFTDKTNALSEMFDVHAIPLSVMINKDRKILMIESGGREWNDDEVHQMLEKWLKD